MALQNLSTEIEDTYDRVMERIEATNDHDRAVVMNFLCWIVFAARPLLVAEIEHACSIAVGTRDIDRDNILGAGELTSMCAGLVIVDAADLVQLVHLSAQTYFREHGEKWFPNGHTILARSCLTYLSFKVFETGAFAGPSESDDFQRRMDHYPLILYSASHWGSHAAHTELLPEVTDQIFDFLRRKPNRESAIQAMWYSNPVDLPEWDARNRVQPLHLAAFFGLNPVVTKLLEVQEDPVDCQDSVGTTPLMYGAARGHTAVVQTLLRRGSDPNLRCQGKFCALHRAIACSHVEVVRHLLTLSTIDVNTTDSAWTPLMLATNQSSEEMVMMLLRIPSLDVNMQGGDCDASTALSIAASIGSMGIVRQILAHPDCDVNKKDRWRTPLSIAAAAGLLSVVEVFLDHGADPEIQGALDCRCRLPLTRAIENGHVGTVKLLLQRGANPRIVGPYNHTIIHSAAIMGQHEVLRILFEKPIGVDVNQQKIDGRTALHEAAYYNHCETIRILFDNGASTHIRDGADRSPLGVAKYKNNIESIELLHKLQNQEATPEDLNGKGPLHHTRSSIDSTATRFLEAVELGEKEAVQAYIQNSKNDINLLDSKRYSALHLAIWHDRIEILKLLLAAPNIRINTLDHLERSPLFWTAVHQNTKAAHLLIHAGAELEFKDHFSESALDVAIEYRDNSNTAIVLLEAGAVPKEKDLQLALWLAARWGSGGLVERLVAMGGDPQRKDVHGKTLVKRAEECENWGVVGTILRLCEEKEKDRGRGKGEGELVTR